MKAPWWPEFFAFASVGFTPFAMLWRPDKPSQEKWTPGPEWRAFQRRWARPAIIHAVDKAA